MLKNLLAFICSFFLLVCPLRPEEKKGKTAPPSFQHEIVVTATRVETPAKEVASSITVITREELEKSKKTNVLEVLQEVLGADVLQNGGTGAAASVFLRGSNSEHVLILLDGVEVNDPMSPSRSYDLAHLSLDNVEQIEILRGPQSTLYGSDALAGVINIISRKGEGKAKFSFASRGGSHKTLSESLSFSGSGDFLYYSLGISHLYSQGISAASTSYSGNREKDGYRNLSASGRLGFQPRENLEFNLLFRSISSKTDLDNSGGAFGDDPNNAQDYKWLFLKGELRTLLLENRWEQKLGLSFIRSDRHHQNSTDDTHVFDSEKGEFKSRSLKLDWQNNLFLHPTNTLTLGIDFEQEHGESEYFYEGIWGLSSSIFSLRKTWTAGFYLQDQIRIANQFFATLGLRLDRHSQSGTALTYRLAPAYFIAKTHTKFKASFGTAFKSPSLYQLYAPGTFWGPIGNEGLKPEKSSGWDLGFEQELFQGKMLFGATYFYSLYRDLILFDFLKGYINIGRARTQGVEIFAMVRPADNLFLRTNYTRLEAKDLDSGGSLLRRPKDKLAASLDYSLFKKWSVRLSLIHTGKRPDRDYSAWPYPEVILHSFTLLNTVTTLNLSSHLEIFCSFENILNEKYELIFGYGTPGFSAYGGFKIQF
ncbi:MAG: TonB-dependent receptor [Candidatus Aminicenantales bacterium]